MIDKPMTLEERFGGQVPNESGLTKEMRLHQGWWRTNVLNEEPGPYPKKQDHNICNLIKQGKESGSNFLTANSKQAVIDTLKNRTKENSGIIEEGRLYNNLLSSQPLSFNFFGELSFDHDFGLLILKTFYKDLTKLNNVIFEFSPDQDYTEDSSAFDVAFEVEAGEKKGLIGWECKYTDTFSYKPSKSDINYGDVGNKNFDTYNKIFNHPSSRFKNPYNDYVKSKEFNQLFRNQLIGEALLQNGNYNFVRTGLFCYQNDQSAKYTGIEFKKMLLDPDSFQTITYSDFIANVQQLHLEWEKREWTMMLWARYCATSLSKFTTTKLNRK
jgi:hypothetical protein